MIGLRLPRIFAALGALGALAVIFVMLQVLDLQAPPWAHEVFKFIDTYSAFAVIPPAIALFFAPPWAISLLANVLWGLVVLTDETSGRTFGPDRVTEATLQTFAFVSLIWWLRDEHAEERRRAALDDA